MTQKNRITYRFDRNGNGQSVNEESRNDDNQQEAHDSKAASSINPSNNSNKTVSKKVVPLYPSTEQHSVSEISPWNSPFQEDIGALEQLIRDADSKPVSTPKPARPNPPKEKKKTAKRAEMDYPYEQIENQKPHNENYMDRDYVQEPHQAYEDEFVDDEISIKKVHYARTKRKAGAPSWFNVFLSVTAALATGALFGYLLLSLFTGASIWPGGNGDKPDSLPVIGDSIKGETGKEPIVSENAGEQEVGLENKNDPVAKPDPNIAMAALKGLDRSYFMLQFGVFSNTEGRDAAMAQLALKGLAGAAMTSASDYRVYVGMGSDRKEAQVIRNMMPETDLYIKEVNIVNPGKIPFKGDQKVAQTFFDQTAALVQMLDDLTIAQLEQPTLSPLSDVAADSWKAEHQKWTENAETLRIGIVDADGKSYLDKLIQAMNTAAKTMIEYDKKPSQAHLWTTQAEVMKVIITQKEWFEKISAL
ncbi:SPOR domain-containing protein [Bacillus sp. FJAT-28004]|uniref:SPOR domain-containing protein n=1 Tax=Bacillus sp. FJAT-28004 TaxID=1679165 RepID=UPI0006B5E338|nr:SPOR domain-containing protein [Bacillus sp. FJAT-28004]